MKAFLLIISTDATLYGGIRPSRAANPRRADYVQHDEDKTAKKPRRQPQGLVWQVSNSAKSSSRNAAANDEMSNFSARARTGSGGRRRLLHRSNATAVRRGDKSSPLQPSRPATIRQFWFTDSRASIESQAVSRQNMLPTHPMRSWESNSAKTVCTL